MSSDYQVGVNVFPFYAKIEVYKYMDALLHISLKERILDGLVRCQDKYKILLHGWAVLPGSVKLVFSCQKEGIMMEDVVDYFMTYTDKRLLDDINHFKNETKKRWMLQMFDGHRRSLDLAFWHPRYYLAPLESQEQFQTCLTDMHESPVRSAVVWDAQHYMYSSAIDYVEGEAGLLPIVKLSNTDSFSY